MKEIGRYMKWFQSICAQRGAFALAIGCLSIAGCSDAPPMGELSGQVTLDGKEVVEGSMRFEPLESKGATGGSLITQGAYKVTLPVNKYRVRISAPKTAGLAGATEGKLAEESIPSKFNVNSDLSAEVKKGDNHLDFPLRSK